MLKSVYKQFVLLAAILIASPAVHAATPEEIDAAIKKGRAYLLKEQLPEGRWEKDAARVGMDHNWQNRQGHSWGGYTALCTYALLASSNDISVALQDPPIAKAMAFLKKADMWGAYSVGVRAQLWTYLPESAERRQLASRDAKILLESLNNAGEAQWLWDYSDPSPKGGTIDHSFSQFGVLGLWAVTYCGQNVNTSTWEGMEKKWQLHQNEAGGWSYDRNGEAPPNTTASMTAAGVATLFITQDYTQRNAGIDCKEQYVNEHIERGVKWLNENIGSVQNDSYTWFGIERIGFASGLKYFGDKDWYHTGADVLLKNQREDGSWDCQYPGTDRLSSTAFAVLFLAKGKAPLVFSKLQYGPERLPTEKATPAPEPEKNPQNPKKKEDEKEKGVLELSTWNQRPRDIANLTRWMATTSEAEYQWQIVDLKVKGEDLHDGPLLFIGGSEAVELTDVEISKLRAFVESGGMIVANANCAKETFSQSIIELGKKLFPKYSFRDLPENHLIFTRVRWKSRPRIQGLSNGVRELIVLLPDADPGRSWQLANPKATPDMFQLGTALLAYVSERVARVGDKYIVERNNLPEPALKIAVAQLEVGENPNPEPGGWRRISNLLHNAGEAAVTVDVVKPTPQALAGKRIAHLTGTTAFELTDAERQAIRKFVETGGTLIIDAAGGSSAFAMSAEKELGTIFGVGVVAELNNPLPPDHALYTWPGHAIPTIEYRRAARQSVGNLKVPQIRGISVGGRTGVFFSREDLSAGMVGNEVAGVRGYMPQSASMIARNIVLYAAYDGVPQGPLTPVKPGETPKPQPPVFDPFDPG